MNRKAQILRNKLAKYKVLAEKAQRAVTEMECGCKCTMIQAEDGAAECSECGYRPGGRFCDVSNASICEFAYPRGESCIYCGISANEPKTEPK